MEKLPAQPWETSRAGALTTQGLQPPQGWAREQAGSLPKPQNPGEQARPPESSTMTPPPCTPKPHAPPPPRRSWGGHRCAFMDGTKATGPPEVHSGHQKAFCRPDELQHSAPRLHSWISRASPAPSQRMMGTGAATWCPSLGACPQSAGPTSRARRWGHLDTTTGCSIISVTRP